MLIVERVYDFLPPTFYPPNPNPNPYLNPYHNPNPYLNPFPKPYPNPGPNHYPNPYPNPYPKPYPNPYLKKYPNPNPYLNPFPNPDPNHYPKSYPSPYPNPYPNRNLVVHRGFPRCKLNYVNEVEVAKNFYKTAEKSSSLVDLAEESKSLADKLLLCNGYTDPRTFMKTHIPTPNMSYISMEEKVCLKIPYVSEFVSYEILRYIRKRKLPINVMFTPGNKLRDTLCKLRPLDKLNCFQSNCKICDLLEDNVKCTFSHPVYQITGKICREKYCGESSRTLHERLSEHLRHASHPNKASYKEQALATHYRECHPGMPPSLSFKLLHTEPNTIMRKIHEALIISNIKPSMNDKNECIDIKRFLICC